MLHSVSLHRATISYRTLSCSNDGVEVTLLHPGSITRCLDVLSWEIDRDDLASVISAAVLVVLGARPPAPPVGRAAINASPHDWVCCRNLQTMTE
jgi:hypothetical protein